jgi:hypothetical protein
MEITFRRKRFELDKGLPASENLLRFSSARRTVVIAASTALETIGSAAMER